MSHIPYTISRSGCYYYNRRVPKHAVKAYGNFIRIALSRCPQESEEYAKRLSYVLEGSWRDTTEIRPVDIISIVESYKPRTSKLSEIAEEYLHLRPIDLTPPRVALSAFILLAGDRDVSEYTREDAKLFVRHLTLKGNKTATIRRRINSLSAILNYAYAELDLDKRNPFSRLIIQNEGDDTPDKLICSYWRRWGAAVCDVESSVNGYLDMSLGCSRFGVLSSATNGMKDLVCNKFSKLIFDGIKYQKVD